MCESDSEGRMKVTSPSQVWKAPPHVSLNNVKGPIISSHLFSPPVAARSLTAATLHPAQ